MSSEGRSDPLTVGFRDVDATAPAKILRCLGTLEAMESVGRYKARALEHLALTPGSAALDVACGLGGDVARMKRLCGRAAGVDRSATLIGLARTRHAGSGCEFERADADALPFPDASFDAVRVDRSLQHIADPGRVVAEMARVTRPGGVVLCAEPDWGTMLLGGPRTPVVARIEHDWVRGFRNPWIGRELSALLAGAGVVDCRWEAHWLSTLGFGQTDVLFEVAATAEKVAADLPEARSWLEAYRASEAYAGVAVLICWGRRA